jgi:Lipocalin-like domain
MKRSILALCSAAFMLCPETELAISAESLSPIVGTWQLTEYSQLILDTKEVIRPFGDHPIGYIQYSPGGHMLVFLTARELKRPSSATYTDAERAEIHKGIINGYVGTYTVDGNKVIHHVLTSSRPEFMGSDQIRYFEVSGKTLIIKTAPIKAVQSGQDIVATLTFEKVE